MTLEEIKARVPIIQTSKGEAKKTRRKIVKFFAVLHATYDEAKAIEQSGLSFKTFKFYFHNSQWFKDMMDWYEFKSLKETEGALRTNILAGNYPAQKFLLQSKNPQRYGNEKGVQEVKDMMNGVKEMSIEGAIDKFIEMIIKSGKAVEVMTKLSQSVGDVSQIEEAIILDEENEI